MMNRPSISVVIPTRNRLDMLRLTLEALDQQESQQSFEVIVADNGSTDGTSDFLKAAAPKRFPLKSIAVSRAGASRARNRAIEAASANRILLLDDDTLPDPGTVAKHAPSAPDRDDEIGIQGLIEWDPQMPITPLMRFLAPEGHQFYFKNLRAEQPIPYARILGCNLSAPARWFREEPFDENFSVAAFEDTELGYRWFRRGWSTIYRPEAVCWHRHHYETIEPFLARQYRAGQAVRYAVRKHPGLIASSLVQPLFVGLCIALQRSWGLARKRPSQSHRWDLEIRLAYFRGFLAGPDRPV
jgi:GT2 family glycosyltransferase